MYERFVQLLQEKNVTAYRVAKDTGIGQSSLTDWKTGRATPKADKLQKIAAYFNVSVDWLLGNTEFRTKDEWFNEHTNSNNRKGMPSSHQGTTKGTIINVLGKVAAGIPIEAIENIVDTEEITEEMAMTGEFFGLKIKGDSMSPRISEGDTVIVKKQEDAESGDIVIAMVNGECATCKRLMKYQEGISLLSFNPIYQPMTFSNEEIEELPIKIIGKVVENRQRY